MREIKYPQKGQYDRSKARPNIGMFKKGHKPLRGAFGRGSKLSQEAKEKVSKSLYGKRGQLARRWKGDLAGYTAIHIWLYEQIGKANKCENLDCLKLPSSRFEYASISGECKRDVSDYIQLCTRCHRRFDNGSLIIRTEDGLIEREKIIEAKCPKCNYLFEVKL